MDAHTILHQRLATQGLAEKRFKTPHDVVWELGAVQAQDFPHSKWGIGLRLKGMNDEDITRAYDEGKILRTHVMRPTWHLVSPEDIFWMQQLTGPRVSRLMGSYNARLGLNEKLFARCSARIGKLLKGNNFLTRQELKKELAKKENLTFNVQKLAHVMMQAEVEGLICSGPLKGKQFTYALIEERAPMAKKLSQEKALEELVTRYFTTHGPATLKDFNWWSGLPMSEAKKGIERVGKKLKSFELNDQIFYFSPQQKKTKVDEETIYLLPNYDEYTIGYTSKHALYLPPKISIFSGSGFYHALVKGGMVVGMWKRTLNKDHFVIQPKLFNPLNKNEHAALGEAVKKYGEFFGRNTRLG